MHELLEETEELLDFGSWHWDLSTNKITMTEGVYNIFEIEPISTPEVPDDFLMQYVIPEDKARVKQALKKSLVNDEDFDCEYTIVTGKNNLRFVSSKGKVVSKDGHLHKMIGITHDITYLKNSDRERERIIRELKQSNKELEEFAYAASHDLQEPLRKITTFGERLSARHSEKLGSDGVLYINRMMTSAKNMRILIDNLLEFSRTTRSTYDFKPVDLNLIVHAVMEELDLNITESNATIHVPYLPEIDAVEAEMKQLFSNLLTNAIKFRKPDARPIVKITSTNTNHVDKNIYHLPNDKEFVTISVVDNGIGFEEEYAGKIFQIFQRLHGKSEFPGSGIGLAICKKIVENHNGVIFTKSELGKGTSFTIILPVKQN
jgi:signal transduction histidine kinase